MTPFIETFTGERFQPLAPDPTTIWIEDIAHALSNQCASLATCASSTAWPVKRH
jgi:hypothetical protein